MADIALVALSLVFFLSTGGLIVLCERLMEEKA